MFGIAKKLRVTKADLEDQLGSALLEVRALKAEIARIKLQHQSLVAQVTYYQGALTDMGNQVQTWMRMHGDVLKQLGEQAPDLKVYADSVAQTIKESYPDPAALIAVIAMGNADTQGRLTSSPTKEIYLSPGEAALSIRDWRPGPTTKVSP